MVYTTQFKSHSQAIWLALNDPAYFIRTLEVDYGGFTLYATLFKRDFVCFQEVARFIGGRWLDYIFNPIEFCHVPKGTMTNNRLNSRLGLFPFHSPLLRKSLLFSFPPLIKMLQFSGFTLFKLRWIMVCYFFKKI